MSVIIAYREDLVSNYIGQTMTQVHNYLQKNENNIVVIDENHFKDLSNDTFGKEAVFAIYKYISEHPEQKIYIGFLLERIDLIGQYVGSTEPKTTKTLDLLYNYTVLCHKPSIFLGENDSFGQEAISTIDAYIRANNRRRVFYI